MKCDHASDEFDGHYEPDDEVDERNCAHEWNQSDAEADESGTRIYCLKCGQDGDA